MEDGRKEEITWETHRMRERERQREREKESRRESKSSEG